eukprot:gene9276-18978_t
MADAADADVPMAAAADAPAAPAGKRAAGYKRRAKTFDMPTGFEAVPVPEVVHPRAGQSLSPYWEHVVLGRK